MLLKVLLHMIRWPLAAMLAIAEPIIRVVLSGLALLTAVVAVFFEFFTVVPNFPFLGMIGASISCVLLLSGYYAVLRLLMVE